MSSKKLYPCKYDWEPIPPGETILEMLKYHSISQKELAERIGCSPKYINQVIDGIVPITPNLAILLEQVLGTSAETWNNLEANYQTHKSNWETKERLREYKTILKKPVILELKKRGYIDNGDPAQEIKSVLCFYRVGSVEILNRICQQPIQAALRHSPSFKSDPLALAAWLQLGERDASKIECKPYNKDRFLKILDQIRELTIKKPDEFVSEIVQLCAAVGVAVVFVPEIKGARVNGATKWLTPNKAMIILNLRGKTNDLFWFTFFHEAAHILYDSKKAFIVEPSNDTKEKNESEKKADTFAASMLIPVKFQNELPTLKTESDFRCFAEKLGIAPGIVVGRMQHEKLLSFNQFNKLKEKFTWK